MDVPSPTIPREICGREVVKILAADRAYLARDGTRQVVLKKLEADCLLGRELHPSINERLARVRELAHMQVATLHGVERDGENVYLVWDYVDGKILERPVNAGLTRELALAIQSLHARGIVHGALHERNIFVKDGRLILTHISPLLFSDPAEDLAALAVLLEPTDHDSQSRPTRSISPRSLLRSPKARSFAAAITVALAGIALTVATFNWWQRNQPIAPPQAVPQEALR